MKQLKILNTREIKRILSLLDKQFSFSGSLDYAFLQNKEDIYLISKDLAAIDTKNFHINNLGLYFANIKNDAIRLSIEGSQLIGSKLGKNILALNEEEAAGWIAGDDIEVSSMLKGWVVIKHKNDYIGTGYIKEDKLLNYIPKERRLRL